MMTKLRLSIKLFIALYLLSITAAIASPYPIHQSQRVEKAETKPEKIKVINAQKANFGDSLIEFQNTIKGMQHNASDVRVGKDVNFSISPPSGATLQFSF